MNLKLPPPLSAGRSWATPSTRLPAGSFRSNGISCAGKTARQITAADLTYFDRIYYMDASNARYLCRLFGSAAAKCRPLLSRDVADPWYTGDFSQTWEDILTGCTRILEELT